MNRLSSRTTAALFGVLMAGALVAGCGSTKASPAARSASSSAGPAVTASASSSAVTSVSPSGSQPASPAASASVQATDPLAHVNPKLEDQLPDTIQNGPLIKFSLILSAFIASPPAGGDKALYPAWLVKFGKTPADVDMAIAFAASDQIDFNARAIAVPGVSAASLSSAFEQVAKSAGWTVKSYPNLMLTGKTVLEMIDPTATAGPTGGAGYVYARDGVLYEIITNDQALLQDALIRMP
jgi:hypothetical protein